MKKIFSLISMFMICLCGMAADDATTLQENHHIYPTADVEVVQSGASATFYLNMINKRNPISTWNCDIALPEGFTFSEVAAYEDGGRYPEGYNASITATPNDNGSVTISCTGADGIAIAAGDGAVAVVTVNIDASVAPGQYDIKVLKGTSVLETPDGTMFTYNLNDKVLSWTVEQGTVVETYNAIFYLEEGDEEAYDVEEVEVGAAIPTPDDPTKEGYTFTGWAPEIPAEMPAENLTFVAQWQVNTYNVIYMVDGEEYQVVPTEYGATIELIEEPTKEGYDFSGWSGMPETMTMPAADVTITGTFSAHYYSTEFYLEEGGELYSGQEVAFGEPLIVPADPEKEGYTFVGWEPAIPETMPAHDMTFVAQWEVGTYTLAFIIDGEVIWSDNVAFGSPIVVPDVPEKEGYVFEGWIEEIPETMPAGEVIINGTYRAVAEFITFTDSYLMFSSDKSLDFTDSAVKAYVATGYNSRLNIALLEQVDVVPAGTGVLLIAEAGTYTVPFCEVQDVPVPETNLFVAVLTESGENWTVYPSTDTSYNYVFNAELKDFDRLVESVDMPNKSAYLQLSVDEVSDQNAAVRFSLFDRTTGIKSIETAAQGEAIYDLQGRRVSNATKGLYIIGGKKVLR